MAVKRTIIEEEQAGTDPKVVRTTKTVVNPDIHTPIVDAQDTVTDSHDSSTVHQTRVIHQPLVKTEHPQKTFETKKTIFRSWQIIWFILAFVEVMLGFRMTFKAIGASAFSGFTSLIYAVTDPLTIPFAGIIRPTISGSSVIEWSTLIAAVVYLVIAWGLVNLINMRRPITPEEVDQNV